MILIDLGNKFSEMKYGSTFSQKEDILSRQTLNTLSQILECFEQSTNAENQGEGDEENNSFLLNVAK
jgi:hypothetical protein